MSLALQVLVLPAVVVGAVVVPVEGQVIRGFDRPLCTYCPGHRGVTIDSRPGDEVVAVTGGVISFSGEVGGLMYVVQTIAPNVRVTYGLVMAVAPNVVEGSWVDAGQVVALANESTYLGVRIGQEYVEPLRFLGLGRVRLVGPAQVVVGAA
jgi:murein DD-endopeptidase MepM/ murein hydrolase activator NlpD